MLGLLSPAPMPATVRGPIHLGTPRPGAWWERGAFEAIAPGPPHMEGPLDDPKLSYIFKYIDKNHLRCCWCRPAWCGIACVVGLPWWHLSVTRGVGGWCPGFALLRVCRRRVPGGGGRGRRNGGWWRRPCGLWSRCVGQSWGAILGGADAATSGWGRGRVGGDRRGSGTAIWRPSTVGCFCTAGGRGRLRPCRGYLSV